MNQSEHVFLHVYMFRERDVCYEPSIFRELQCSAMNNMHWSWKEEPQWCCDCDISGTSNIYIWFIFQSNIYGFSWTLRRRVNFQIWTNCTFFLFLFCYLTLILSLNASFCKLLLLYTLMEETVSRFLAKSAKVNSTKFSVLIFLWKFFFQRNL